MHLQYWFIDVRDLEAPSYILPESAAAIHCQILLRYDGADYLQINAMPAGKNNAVLFSLTSLYEGRLDRNRIP